MRRFFIIFAAFFVLQSVCAQSFKVNASVEGLPDGTVLTLTPLSHAKLAPIAEATVKNGKCVFEGTITQDVPLCVRMQVKDCLGRTTFMVDKNDDIQLSCSFTADGDNNGVPIYKISDPKVIGSPLTDEYYRISKEVEQGKKDFGQFRSFLGKRLSYMTEKRKEVKSREDNDSLMKNDPQFAKEVHMFNYMDSIMVLKMNSQTIASLFKYGDSFWGPLMMLDVWWYFTPRERPVFDLFSDEAKNCWYGRQVREELYPGDSAMLAKEIGSKPNELENIIQHWLCHPDKARQCIPTDDIVITIDKDAVRRSGMMMAADSIPDEMHISLAGRSYISKSELMMYAALAGSKWERPLYVAVTVGEGNYRSFANNTIQEGLAMRITPFNTRESGKRIDADRMYDNLMNRYRYGGIDNPNIYLDETVLRMVYTHRSLFSMCANELIKMGDTERALKLLEKAEKVIPSTTVPHNMMGGSMTLASCWLQLGKKKQAKEIALAVAQNQIEYADWYRQLPASRFKGSILEMYRTFDPLISAASILYRANDEKGANALTDKVQINLLYTLQQITSYITADLALPYNVAQTKDNELQRLFQYYQSIMEDYNWYLSEEAYTHYSKQLQESYMSYVKLLHSDWLRQDEDNSYNEPGLF